MTDEWIKKLSHIYIMEYYLARRKDELLNTGETEVK